MKKKDVKKKNLMTVEVYSTIKDENAKKNLKKSPLWLSAYTKEEVEEEDFNFDELWKYTIKFDGVTPIYLTKVERVI